MTGGEWAEGTGCGQPGSVAEGEGVQVRLGGWSPRDRLPERRERQFCWLLLLFTMRVPGIPVCKLPVDRCLLSGLLKPAHEDANQL